MSEDEITLLVHSPLAEFKHRLRSLKNIRIQSILKHLDQLQNHQSRQKKAASIMQHLFEKSDLEGFGQGLTSTLACDCFNISFSEPELHKLHAVLVGLPHPLFTTLLTYDGREIENTLRKLAGGEPLQHHLTLFSHGMELEITRFIAELEQVEEMIDRQKPGQVSPQQLHSLLEEIEKTIRKGELNSNKLRRALAIAWNSERTDLIETLSMQKENWQKLRKFAIGYPHRPQCEPTGLYARINNHLSRIFGERDDPQHLRDSDPAIEGLAKLGVWYLRDYWDLGLLPGMDIDHIREEERGKLLSTARRELAARGLKTVRDLKSRWIFSKRCLENFLERA